MLMEVFDSLRVLTPLSGTLRLLCAIFFGGLIGLDRERKGRAAGFRTYMLVCMCGQLRRGFGSFLPALRPTGQPRRGGAAAAPPRRGFSLIYQIRV